MRNANPTGSELKDAIAAVLDGRRGEGAARRRPSAARSPRPRPPSATPTYSKDVAAILQKNCQECHRRGQVGPFPLETYEQARKRAADIATVVEDRAMPPWKASPQVGPKFKHDRSLSEQDIATLVGLGRGRRTRGRPGRPAPARASSPTTGRSGRPDLVLDIGTDFAIPATGDDIYRCFVIPTNLPEDMYVSAIEYRPGNRRVVHHILAYVDTTGEARKRDAADPGPGYTCFSGPGVAIHGDLGGWAPGNEPSQLPDGIGRSLPSECRRDHPGPLPPQRQARDRPLADRPPLLPQADPADPPLERSPPTSELKLPAGESNIEVKAAWPVPVDVDRARRHARTCTCSAGTC